MKARGLEFLPCACAAAGLALFAGVFAVEYGAFRAAVRSWALRDLSVRTELAAHTLEEPLATGDFRALRTFGDACTRDGVRLTVYSAPGGIVFDTLAHGAPPPDDLYAAAPAGEFKVRLGLPRSRVFAPFDRARPGLVLAALVGASGVLLVFLFTWRWRARMRTLAAERDAERRRAEQLERDEKYRRAFVSDVSHEIKTPLTGILGAVDLLCGEPAPAETDRRTLLDALRKEAHRLDALAQDVLDLARLDRVDEAPHREAVSLRGVLEETASRFRPRAAAAGVALSVLPGADATAFCDAALLERALANLVSNALRHSASPDVVLALEVPPSKRRDAASPRGGVGGSWFVVGARTTSHEPRTTNHAASPSARLVVEDHGKGIPGEHREKIFERFHRVDAARAEGEGGAGLGLAIVRRAARLNGGDCVLETPAGGGCRFVVTVPLAEVP